jgi:hypothetical protein
MDTMDRIKTKEREKTRKRGTTKARENEENRKTPENEKRQKHEKTRNGGESIHNRPRVVTLASLKSQYCVGQTDSGYSWTTFTPRFGSSPRSVGLMDFST